MNRWIPRRLNEWLQPVRNFGCDACETHVAATHDFCCYRREGSNLQVYATYRFCTACRCKSFLLLKVELPNNRVLLALIRLFTTRENFFHDYVTVTRNLDRVFDALHFGTRHPAVTRIDRLYENVAVGPVERDDLDKCDECHVCLKGLALGDMVSKLLRCGHFFHSACIGNWALALEFRLTCPLCRDECSQELIHSVIHSSRIPI